ncbi:hypothetical protein [Chlamydiifrater phoenicopteri]|uniref:hypothetical protein n=1 Tax=Chlamydiifrater phoenicopteri TaxID=2681469 RepID=UPI001BCCC68C|nr:hypothetical protein [Chlamydiifrater phoenicopteri]
MTSGIESFCKVILSDTSDFFGETSGSSITTKIKAITVVAAAVIGIIVAHVGLSFLSGNVLVCAVAGLSLALAGVTLSVISLLLLVKLSRFYVHKNFDDKSKGSEEIKSDSAKEDLTANSGKEGSSDNLEGSELNKPGEGLGSNEAAKEEEQLENSEVGVQNMSGGDADDNSSSQTQAVA